MWPTSSRSLRCALMVLARRSSLTHWGVHDGKYPVQRKSSLMRVDFRDFPSAPAGWFDDRFSDGRSKRSLSYDLLYLGGACRCQRLGVLSRVIFSPLRSAWSMWIWSGNQDEAPDSAKETDGVYRCQMVPNGATLVLLPPVTTGSEEDPGTPAGRLDPGSSPASRGNPGWDV